MLTDFFSVKYSKLNLEKVRNASHMKGKIDTALTAELVNYYKSTYQFVESKFGKEVYSLWSGYQYNTNE